MPEKERKIMKKSVTNSKLRFLAILLAAVMLTALLPLSALAYGSTDKTLVITHMNTPASTEGSGIIYSPSFGTDLTGQSGTFSWWVMAVFEWSEADACYKVKQTLTVNNGSVDKQNTLIPEKGFVYAACVGNNYEGGINYNNEATYNSVAYIKTLTVGQKAYLYGADLYNGLLTINTPDKQWYEDGYSSGAYIKMDTPDEGKTAYDPNDEAEAPIVLPLTHKNKSGEAGNTVLFTDEEANLQDYGAQTYGWWKTATFMWDQAQGCFIVISISTKTGSDMLKDPYIPLKGFVVATHSSTVGGLIDRLSVGNKAFVYDVELDDSTAGTSTGSVYVNVADPEKTPFTYSVGATQTPVIEEATGGKVTGVAGNDLVLTLSNYSSSASYEMSLNRADLCVDGSFVSGAASLKDGKITISASAMTIGAKYTLCIQNGSGIPAILTIYAISAEADSSSLKAATIVAFGDSITDSKPWQGIVSARFGTELIDSGVGGDTSSMGKARFKSDVLDMDPDIVLINFGMNDQAARVVGGAPNVSLETYISNLRYFAKELTDRGIDVVFVTPNPVYDNPEYYNSASPSYGINYAGKHMVDFCRAMRSVAAEYNCSYVDMYAYFTENLTLSTVFNKGDGIHPNANGYSYYAAEINKLLAAKYDNINKRSTAVSYQDEAGNELSSDYTLIYALGSTYYAPVKLIDGYNFDFSDLPEVTTSGNGQITCTYTAGSIVLKDEKICFIEGDYLYLLEAGISWQTLSAHIETKGLRFTSSNTNYVENGAVIELLSGSTVLASLTVVILGDLTSDGLITALDYFALKRAYLKVATLSDTEMKAADFLGDGKITAAHYFDLKRHVLKVSDIFELYLKK